MWNVTTTLTTYSVSAAATFSFASELLLIFLHLFFTPMHYGWVLKTLPLVFNYLEEEFDFTELERTHKDQLQNAIFFKFMGNISLQCLSACISTNSELICTQFSLRQLQIVMIFSLCPGHVGVQSTPSFLEDASHTTQSKPYKTKAFLLIYSFVICRSYSKCRCSLGISGKNKNAVT